MNIPPEAAEIVRSLWYKANLTLEDIGSKVQRSASTVGHWGKVMGLGRRRKDTDWTDEQEQELAKVWAEGLSATQVAQNMTSREGLTREAVLGKVHRLGLCGRAEVNKPGRPASPKRPKGNGRKKPFVFTMAASRKRTPPQEAASLDHLPALEGKGITILDLTDETCRWPLWDEHDEGEKRYCGHKAPVDEQYCPYHGRVAYQGGSSLKARGL